MDDLGSSHGLEKLQMLIRKNRKDDQIPCLERRWLFLLEPVSFETITSRSGFLVAFLAWEGGEIYLCEVSTIIFLAGWINAVGVDGFATYPRIVPLESQKARFLAGDQQTTEIIYSDLTFRHIYFDLYMNLHT